MEMVEDNPSQHTLEIWIVPWRGKPTNQSTKKVMEWEGGDALFIIYFKDFLYF